MEIRLPRLGRLPDLPLLLSMFAAVPTCTDVVESPDDAAA